MFALEELCVIIVDIGLGEGHVFYARNVYIYYFIVIVILMVIVMIIVVFFHLLVIQAFIMPYLLSSLFIRESLCGLKLLPLKIKLFLLTIFSFYI